MSKKPISPKTLAANRRNARKSTGPKTPDGKARSSRNALKHGLLAHTIILDDNDPAECTADFEHLLDQLITDLHPTDSLQRLLVERIAVSYWRLRRAHRFEANAIRDLRDGTSNPTAHLVRAIIGQATPRTDLVLPASADLDKLVRYESMIDRELNRTLTQLRRLQRHPNSPPPSPPPSVRPPVPNEPTRPTPPTAHQVVPMPQSHSSSPEVPLASVPPVRSDRSADAASHERLNPQPKPTDCNPWAQTHDMHKRIPARRGILIESNGPLGRMAVGPRL